MTKRNLARAVAFALLGASAPAFAITSVENNSTIPFSFSNPGARSLAMGGAFLALADDATAAYTNPAGLTSLGLEQQVSAEFRANSYDVPYANSGTASIDPLNLSGVNYGNASDDISDLSFLSWVLPRDTWALALYRHQLLNYESNYTTEPIVFGNFFTNPYRAKTDLEIVSYGASFAYNFNDSLSIGAGITYYDFEIDTTAERFDPNFGGIDGTNALISTQVQRGDDHDVGFNLGLIYRGSDRFSIGLAYRSAPDFEYRAQNIAGPALLAVGLGGQTGIFTGQLLGDKTTPFEAPDMFGIGFSWRASDRLTINLDLNRIAYSNLSDDIENVFFNDEANQLTITTQRPILLADGSSIPAGSSFPLFLSEQQLAVARSIAADDVFEPRLGAEYVFDDMTYPLSIRGGIWREEQHTLRFEVDPERFGVDEVDEARGTAILFSGGDDELHLAAGFGLAFERFQVDFAYDRSDRQDTMSLSGVVRF